MTSIEPLTIAPQGEHGLALARIAIIVAVLASLPWIRMLHQERATNDRLLADKQARMMRVESLTIRYGNGVKSVIHIKEKTE